MNTTVGFTRAALTHQLNLTAIDRTGTPETTQSASYGNLMDLTDGQLYYVSFSNGAGTIWGTRDNQLIAGHSYAFLGQIGTFGPGPYYTLQSWTQVAEPQITLNSDQSFTFDARKAGLIDVRTQRPGISLYGCSQMSRSAPQGFFLAFTACGDAPTRQAQDIYTLAGGQATSGTFQQHYYTHRAPPPITITAHGLDTPLLPRYPLVQVGGYTNSDGTNSQPRFQASARLQVADVGTGSTAEITAAHVAGKVALLHPPISNLITVGSDGSVSMQLDGATAKAIAAAGATGILVAPPADGIWRITYNQPDVPVVPTALLSAPEAAQLSNLLTTGRSAVTVTTASPGPYSYDLVFAEPGQGLTDGATFSVRDDDLARVVTRYHSTTPGQYEIVSIDPVFEDSNVAYNEDIPLRTVRTEMYTADVDFGQGRVRDTTDPELATYQFEVINRSLAAGEYEMNVGSGPWVPDDGRVATFGSSLLTFPPDLMASSAGFQFSLYGFPNTTTFVCQPPACQQQPSGSQYPYKLSGDGIYQVINDAAESSSFLSTTNPLSVRVHTEWTVDVHLSTQQNQMVVQPMLQATWYVEGGLDNVVPADKPYQVRVAAAYPDGTGSDSTGPGGTGPVTARLWATYDDGQTWVPVHGTRVVQLGQPATFTLRTPAHTNGFVGYRVQMSDANGNAIDQTVIRAAYTQLPA